MSPLSREKVRKVGVSFVEHSEKDLSKRDKSMISYKGKDTDYNDGNKSMYS